MAALISFNGSTINAADTTTDYNVLKITSGGATPAVEVADGQIQGSGAVTTTVSGKRIVLYFDVGAGRELDFSANTGIFSTHELIYIWGNFLAPGLLNSSTAGGFGVFLESNTPAPNQYKLYYFYGNDNYTGGWKRFVIDPIVTPSASAGSALNLGAIRYIGLFAETTATARFDNLIIDSIDRGFGLRVSGSTTDNLFTEMLDWESTNRKGVFTSLNDSNTAAELRGRIDIGLNNFGSSAATNLADLNGKMFLDAPLYYDGSAFVRSAEENSFGWDLIGGAGTQAVNFGAKVGTTGGRNGTTFVGNNIYQMNIGAQATNFETANFYGCSFELFAGGIVLWSGSNEVMGCTFAQCGSVIFNSANVTITETLFVQTGRVQIAGSTMSDCRFINSTGTVALAVGSSVSTISDLIFTSSGTGHAIEITGGTTHTLNNITFNGYAASNGSTGNEAVYVNIASGNVTINSDSALSYRTAGATVTVVAGQKTLNITNVKSGSDVVIKSSGTTTKLQDDQDIAGTTSAYSYTYSAGTFVDVAVYAEGYVPYFVNNFELPANGGTIQVSQQLDRNYTP